MSLRVAFFGTPAFSVPILESIANNHTVVAVVSQPDKPVGKGGQISPSAVSLFAREHGLPLLTPNSIRNDEVFKQDFQSRAIDVSVVAAYGKILPQWLLDVPKLGSINIHASLLPQYRGASPIVASILNGNSETGITYIVMNNKMDEGDIIYQSKLDINADETTRSLSIKLSQNASKDINTILQKYADGELIKKSQDHTKATYCQILSKQDGQIDFDNPPQNLKRMIRAYYPWPGVWGIYKGKRVKLLPENKVQMEGKKSASIAEFKHGYPDFPLSSID